MPILKAVGITKEFPGVKALRNVNFEVEAGEYMVNSEWRWKIQRLLRIDRVYKQILHNI